LFCAKVFCLLDLGLYFGRGVWVKYSKYRSYFAVPGKVFIRNGLLIEEKTPTLRRGFLFALFLL
jgi:hypothetical protein